MKIAHNPKEIIALVDEKDRVIGKSPRKNHAQGKLHREVAVLVLNKNNEVLVQLRSDPSMKKYHFFDYSAAGHFGHKESYLDGAIREVKEELGLNLRRSRFKKVLKSRLTWKNGPLQNDRFVTLYEVKGDFRIEDIKIDKNEVESAQFYSFAKLKSAFRKSENGGFKTMMELYFKKKKI